MGDERPKSIMGPLWARGLQHVLQMGRYKRGPRKTARWEAKSHKSRVRSPGIGVLQTRLREVRKSLVNRGIRNATVELRFSPGPL